VVGVGGHPQRASRARHPVARNFPC
jgi:hypothetical protein